jgi:hypothetical protein
MSLPLTTIASNDSFAGVALTLLVLMYVLIGAMLLRLALIATHWSNLDSLWYDF